MRRQYCFSWSRSSRRDRSQLSAKRTSLFRGSEFLDQLEDRQLLSTFSLSVPTSTFNIDMNTAGQTVYVQSLGSSYTFTLIGGVWPNSSDILNDPPRFSVNSPSRNVLTLTSAGVALVNNVNIIDDATGIGVTFVDSGSNAFATNVNVTLDQSPGVVTFTGASSFSGSNTLTLSTAKNIVFNSGSSLTMANGAMSLNANTQGVATVGNFVGIDVNHATVQATGTGTLSLGGRGGNDGSGYQYGVEVRSGGKIQGGTGGTVNVTGTGGAGAGSRNDGVYLTGANSSITSVGANVTITGVEGSQSSSRAITLANAGVAAAGGSAGNLTLACDSLVVDATAYVQGSALGTVNLNQRTNGVAIQVGSTTDTSGGPLAVSNDEFARISGAKINMGNANSGLITLGQPVTVGSDLSFTSPAAAGVLPAASGTDLDVVGKTISFATGSPLKININGTTLDSQYSQLNTTGAVNLTGANLALGGSYTPVTGDEFVVVSAASVTGTFNGLPDGSTTPFNGKLFLVTYTPTSVVLDVVVAPSFITPPHDLVVNHNAAALFTSVGSGVPRPAIQWQVNSGSGWSNISGATAANYSFPAQPEQDTFQYRVIYSNLAGTVTSDPATLTVKSGAATFSKSDLTTQGNWKSRYGADGFVISQDKSAANNVIPAYATVTYTDANNYTWSNSTTSMRGLQRAPASARDYMAGTWYNSSSFSIDVETHDKQFHQVALYSLDWDNQGRNQTIQVIEDATGIVLSSQSISNFQNGAYLVWNVKGGTTFKVINNSPTNSVIAGLFFGGSTVLPNQSDFLNQDTTTGGNWKGAYGADGVNVSQDSSPLNANYPAYAQVAFHGTSNAVLNQSPADARNLQRVQAGNLNRITGVWFSNSAFTIDVNITDGQTHQVAVYAVDADRQGRSEMIQVIDNDTGSVMDIRSISGFQNGVYLVWNLQGHVTFNFLNTGTSNAVLSGLFFGGASAAAASAGFVAQDTTTRGSWKGQYGNDGSFISQDQTGGASALPSYAAVSVKNASNYVWNPSTQDARGLQKTAASSTDRLKAAWYSNDSFTAAVNFNDGQTHQVALYAADWDSASRSETIQVIDSATGAVLDSRDLSGFQNGVYLVWNIRGSVIFNIMNTGKSNAVLSGIFFG